jgi:hypothetical protein
VPPPSIVVTRSSSAGFDLLRADEVDVRIDAARGEDSIRPRRLMISMPGDS